MIEVMEKEVKKDWYQKAENVLMSSTNQEQLNVAFKYIEFYKTQTSDTAGYEILLRKYINKKEQLDCE